MHSDAHSACQKATGITDVVVEMPKIMGFFYNSCLSSLFLAHSCV